MPFGLADAVVQIQYDDSKVEGGLSKTRASVMGLAVSMRTVHAALEAAIGTVKTLQYLKLDWSDPVKKAEAFKEQLESWKRVKLVGPVVELADAITGAGKAMAGVVEQEKQAAEWAKKMAERHERFLKTTQDAYFMMREMFNKTITDPADKTKAENQLDFDKIRAWIKEKEKAKEIDTKTAAALEKQAWWSMTIQNIQKATEEEGKKLKEKADQRAEAGHLEIEILKRQQEALEAQSVVRENALRTAGKIAEAEKEAANRAISRQIFEAKVGVSGNKQAFDQPGNMGTPTIDRIKALEEQRKQEMARIEKESAQELNDVRLQNEIIKLEMEKKFNEAAIKKIEAEYDKRILAAKTGEERIALEQQKALAVSKAKADQAKNEQDRINEINGRTRELELEAQGKTEAAKIEAIKTQYAKLIAEAKTQGEKEALARQEAVAIKAAQFKVENKRQVQFTDIGTAFKHDFAAGMLGRKAAEDREKGMAENMKKATALLKKIEDAAKTVGDQVAKALKWIL